MGVRDFPHLSITALWPTQPPFKTGTGSFLGVKSGRGVTLTPHPLLVPLVMKEYSYSPTPPMGRTACTEPQCLYKGAVYLYLYLSVRNAPSINFAAGRITSMKNSSDTIGDQTPDLPACSTVPQPNAPPRSSTFI